MNERPLKNYLSRGERGGWSSEARDRGRLVNGMTTIAIVFVAGLGALAFAEGNRSLAIVDMATAALFAALLIFYWETGRYDVSALVGIVVTGGFFCYLFASGGYHQTAYVWYYVFPLAATYFLGAYPGIVGSAILLVFALVVFVIDPIGPGWAEYESAFELRFVASYVVVLLFAFVYERSRFTTQQSLRGALAQLTDTQQNLSLTADRMLEQVRKRVEAVAEMEAATTEARRANAAKSEFLAHVSHELRTPLNHIIGFSELVFFEKAGKLNERQKDYLQDVVSSSRHLLAIIDDVLDLSRAETGKMTVTPTEFDLHDTLRNALRIVEDQAAAKQANIVLDVSPLPGKIVADERMIRQVIYNLLQNAVKFVNRGGHVRVSASQSPHSADYVVCSVADDGVGVSRENLDRIFSPFEQIRSANRTEHGGAGLGLALCRQFVELHDGTIWADSDGLGRGMTVAFRLPVRSKEVQ